MRKHDVRKWLHAVLDLLPVILIPVFMIYSHRHDPAIASTYTKEEPVYYQSNEVDSFDDLQMGNIYQFTYKDEQPLQSNQIIFSVSYIVEMSFTNKNTYNTTIQQNQRCYIFDYGDHHYFRYFFLDGEQYKYTDYYDFIGLIVYQDSSNSTDVYTYLTQTTQQVQSGVEEVIYDFDKDIMGAFTNNFNFTINKYFNMGNVFNLGDVYQWFNTNIFGGNAPAVMFSVWNIVLYEFVMDLMFLLYGLFMWFIDMVEKLMEKPINSVR